MEVVDIYTMLWRIECSVKHKTGDGCAVACFVFDYVFYFLVPENVSAMRISLGSNKVILKG